MNETIGIAKGDRVRFSPERSAGGSYTTTTIGIVEHVTSDENQIVLKVWGRRSYWFRSGGLNAPFNYFPMGSHGGYKTDVGHELQKGDRDNE